MQTRLEDSTGRRRATATTARRGASPGPSVRRALIAVGLGDWIAAWPPGATAGRGSCHHPAVRTAPGTRELADTTVVLVHGSGHTARVWGDVQRALRHPSVAVDLPGRADRVADIADVTIDDAAASLLVDVEATTDGRVVLVGHSAGGIVLPALAARLGRRVQHLVFVAGLSAKDGASVMATVRPDAVEELDARLRALRAEHAGCMLEPDAAVEGVRAIDAKTAAPLDSLNYMAQVVSWAGVRGDVPRTFVRCLRDRIQPRSLQAALAENCGASAVVDLESGHTPAVAVPEQLAAVVDRLASQSLGGDERASIVR